MTTLQTRRTKIAEAKAAIRQARANRITVGGYDLYWFDERNWCVEPTGNMDDDRRRFHPTFTDGASALLKRLTDRAAKDARSLEEIVRAVRAAEQAVVNAVQARRSP